MKELIYVVTINSRSLIPFFNKIGPITYPVNITASQYEVLLRRGLDIDVIEILDPAEEERKAMEAAKYEAYIDAASIQTNNAPEFIKNDEEVAESLVGTSTITEREVIIDDLEEEQEAVTEAEKEDDDSVVEVKFLTPAEIDALESGDLRDYLAQFESFLDAKELNIVKTAQRKRLQQLAKDVVDRLSVVR